MKSAKTCRSPMPPRNLTLSSRFSSSIPGPNSSRLPKPVKIASTAGVAVGKRLDVEARPVVCSETPMTSEAWRKEREVEVNIWSSSRAVAWAWPHFFSALLLMWLPRARACSHGSPLPACTLCSSEKPILQWRHSYDHTAVVLWPSEADYMISSRLPRFVSLLVCSQAL